MLRTPAAPPHSPPCPICGHDFAQEPKTKAAVCVAPPQLVCVGRCLNEYRRREKGTNVPKAR